MEMRKIVLIQSTIELEVKKHLEADAFLNLKSLKNLFKVMNIVGG